MPKLEGFTIIKDGIHRGTVTGIEYRNANRSDNPMLVLEVALEDGQLVNVYCVVTVDGSQIYHMLLACDRTEIAERLRRKKIPEFELDDLIGTAVVVHAQRGHCDLGRKLY